MDPEKRQWDAIIIGTGIGGATIGHALTRAGWNVLFCEKGRSHLGTDGVLRGAYAECFFPRTEVAETKHRELLVRAGRWPEEIEDRSGPHTQALVPFLGSGTGGSSTLYGMAMERFHASDFEPRRKYPNIRQASLPEAWPITYEELRPYYVSAERLYRVRGTADPLRLEQQPSDLMDPGPLHEPNEYLFEFFRTKGLHPYRLPLACELKAECSGCQGYICDAACKNDSARICLGPALALGNAHLLDNCHVLRLKSDRDSVTAATCLWNGEEITLRAGIFVLAAGALRTPAILLRSTSANWPNGLANRSGLVGRNLMRHCVDLYAIFTKANVPRTGNLKEIAFSDLYDRDGVMLGSVQSFGRLPPASLLVAQMQDDIRKSGRPLMASLYSCVKPIVRLIASQLSSRSVVLATLLEDLPFPNNRVGLSDSDRVIIRYRLNDHDLSRIAAFRKHMSELISPHRFLFIKQAENNRQLAHACGTCRFGADPKDSVLDPTNCAHGLNNLYIVDGSFFPTSGGANPALTIAANALRVADSLLGR